MVRQQDCNLLDQGVQGVEAVRSESHEWNFVPFREINVESLPRDRKPCRYWIMRTVCVEFEEKPIMVEGTHMAIGASVQLAKVWRWTPTCDWRMPCRVEERSSREGLRCITTPHHRQQTWSWSLHSSYKLQLLRHIIPCYSPGATFCQKFKDQGKNITRQNCLAGRNHRSWSCECRNTMVEKCPEKLEVPSKLVN